MTKKIVLPQKDINSKPQTTEESLYQTGEYEITPDDDFKIEFYITKIDKRWVIRREKSENTEYHWVIFRMWSYEEEIELRKKATSFDEIKRLHSLDNNILDRFKIQRLLKSWSFEEKNQRLKLHHVNGILTDECYKNVMKLHPTVLRFIIQCMNEVLEQNG